METGSGSMGLGKDKHLKVDRPDDIIFLSTAIHPIKITTVAPEDLKSLRANQIAKIAKIQVKLLQ